MLGKNKKQKEDDKKCSQKEMIEKGNVGVKYENSINYGG